MLAFTVLFSVIFLDIQNVCGENEIFNGIPMGKHRSIPFTPASSQESDCMDKTWGYITKRINEMIWSAENDVCSTPGCQKAARGILRDMNKHADPCDDFYEFACGNFIKRTKVPDDKGEIDAFSELNDRVTEQLRVVMEEPSATDEARPYRMAKDLYRTCMDTDEIEKIGLSDITYIIHKMGGWPVLDGDHWNASKFTWTDTVHKLRDEGFDFGSLILFQVEPDSKNNTKRVISLDQASLSLRESLVKGMDDKVVQALYSYMVDIAVMFGADRDRATKELKESLDFQIQLAEVSSPPEQRRDYNRLYNPMTIPQLQENYPSIPWAEYISNILPKSVQVEPNEVVIVEEPTYISRLEILLSKTPKRTQANYMLWQAVMSAVPYLTENLRKLTQKFETVRSGETKSEPRWKECVGNVYESLTLAVSSMYVQRFVKKEVKKSALEIVVNVRGEMYKTLQNTDWMDDYTRKNALMKAKAMRADIAYPDELLDVIKLEDYYEKLEITQENFLESILNINKFSLNFTFGRLREPVLQNEWINHGGAATVNAFYESVDNSIEFPAGILQGAFFSNDRPNYMNYGAIGFVIGHEITHGFDDQGRQFDKDGNLVDWWAPETKEAYLKKVDCIVNQYGNYTDKQVGQKLNGVNTQGENIADNGGIKLAYRAYNHWVAEHGTEKRLPGLQDFTPLQMFWISAANSYCTNYRPEYLKSVIVNDVHSPAEFRVRGPFSNRPEFSKDFNCPMGCKMNPPNKCEIW